MNQKFLYSGYILTNDSIALLRSTLVNLSIELYPNQYLHHTTIDFGEDNLPEQFVGQSRTLTVTGLVVNEYGMAFIVDCAYFSNNAIPHITVCTKEGYSPVYSNILLSLNQSEVIYYPLDVLIETFIQKIYLK